MLDLGMRSVFLWWWMNEIAYVSVQTDLIRNRSIVVPERGQTLRIFVHICYQLAGFNVLKYSIDGRELWSLMQIHEYNSSTFCRPLEAKTI